MNQPSTPTPHITADETLEELSTCLFVIIWGFPEPSQTFIQREMEHLARRGGRVQVLAGHRVPRTDLAPVLEEIADRAMYLGGVRSWLPKGISYAVRHPRRFGEALRWTLTLPHRTIWHRLRMGGLLLPAASVADRVQARGITYLHAHFAAYHTELVMALSRLTGVPYGFTAHATGIWKDRNLLREKIDGARLVMTCTRHNAEHLRRLAPAHAEDVHLVYHGLDLEAMPEHEPVSEDTARRFLAVGRLVPKKGFTHLIDAMARLRERGISAHLTILGDGPERADLEKKVADRDLRDYVSMPGTVPNRIVWQTLAESHALVAPSVQASDGNLDGIPNVILEAMAMKRPVVASRISGIPEVVHPGETGMLVEPEDVDDLADAMAVLSSEPELAAEMGRRGHQFVRRHFDVRENAARQLELLAAATQLKDDAHAS